MDAKMFNLVAKQIVEHAFEVHLDLLQDDRGDQISVADVKAIKLEQLHGQIEMIMENIRDELWLEIESLKPVARNVTIVEDGGVKYSLGFEYNQR